MAISSTGVLYTCVFGGSLWYLSYRLPHYTTWFGKVTSKTHTSRILAQLPSPLLADDHDDNEWNHLLDRQQNAS